MLDNYSLRVPSNKRSAEKRTPSKSRKSGVMTAGVKSIDRTFAKSLDCSGDRSSIALKQKPIRRVN